MCDDFCHVDQAIVVKVAVSPSGICSAELGIKLMKTLTKLMLGIGVISLSACAINRESANFDPDKDMVKTDIVYVEHFEPDKRELNKIIADSIARPNQNNAMLSSI